MKRTIIGALFAVLAVFGVVAAAPAAAAPVPAGNGTSNFYYARDCGLNLSPLGSWAAIKWTNYDSGKNQIVHTNITRSGPGILVQVWINGVFVESGDLEDFYTWPGWSKVSVMLRASASAGSTWSNCTRTAP